MHMTVCLDSVITDSCESVQTTVILLIPSSLHCWETCMKRLTKTSPAPRITMTARKWMPCRTASASCANLELCKSRAVLGWLLPPSYGSSWRFLADSSLSSLTLMWNVTSPIFAVWPILAHMGCRPSLLSRMSCSPPGPSIWPTPKASLPISTITQLSHSHCMCCPIPTALSPHCTISLADSIIPLLPEHDDSHHQAHCCVLD